VAGRTDKEQEKGAAAVEPAAEQTAIQEGADPGGRLDGFEVIKDAAQRILGAPLSRLTDAEKGRLRKTLAMQCAARVIDRYNDEQTAEICKAVLKADAAIAPMGHKLHPCVVDFVVAQTGGAEGIQGGRIWIAKYVADEMDGWAVYGCDCDNPDCPNSFMVVDKETDQKLRELDREDPPIFGGFLSIFGFGRR
jgi:hypothetical protein